MVNVTSDLNLAVDDGEEVVREAEETTMMAPPMMNQLAANKQSDQYTASQVTEENSDDDECFDSDDATTMQSLDSSVFDAKSSLPDRSSFAGLSIAQQLANTRELIVKERFKIQEKRNRIEEQKKEIDIWQAKYDAMMKKEAEQEAINQELVEETQAKEPKDDKSQMQQ